MTAYFRTIFTKSSGKGLRLTGALLCCLFLFGSGPARAATLELAGPPGAKLIINKQRMSYLPLNSPLQLAAGEYTIRCEMPGYSTYEQTITLTGNDWLRLHIRLTPLKRSTATWTNFPIAGLGQFYMGKKTKGWIFLLTETGALVAALAGQLQFSDYEDDYQLLKNDYDTAVSPEDIEYYRELSDTAYQNMKDAESMRDTGLIVAGVAIAVSMLDALLFFPAAEGGVGPAPPVVGLHDTDPQMNLEDLTSAHLGIRLSF